MELVDGNPGPVSAALVADAALTHYQSTIRANYFAFASQPVCIRSVGWPVQGTTSGPSSNCPSRDWAAKLDQARATKRHKGHKSRSYDLALLDCFRRELRSRLDLLLHSAKHFDTTQIKAQKVRAL